MHGIGLGYLPREQRKTGHLFLFWLAKAYVVGVRLHSIGDFFPDGGLFVWRHFLLLSADAELAVGMNCQIGKIVSFKFAAVHAPRGLKGGGLVFVDPDIVRPGVGVLVPARVFGHHDQTVFVVGLDVLHICERDDHILAAVDTLADCVHVFGPSKIFLKSSQAASCCRAEWARAWRCISHIEILRDPALADIR